MPSREKVLPACLFLVLAIVAYLLDFNGLYGQDAHEYLRQTQVFYARLQGLPVPPAGQGEVEFGAGFPLLGALATFFTGNAVISLQLISWTSAALAVHFFLAGCRYLLPGSKTESRFLFGLFMLSAPLFMRSGLTSMSDMPALAMALAGIRYSADAGEHRNGRLLLLAVLTGGIAVLIRPAMVALLAPVLGWAFWRLFRRRQLWAVSNALGLGILISGIHFWVKQTVHNATSFPSVLHNWSFFNFFKRHFSAETGILDYTLPNGIHILSPLAHHGYFIATFLLFFLFKKTDLHLDVKRVLLCGLLFYLVLIGGLPVQSIRYLLPVWAVGLWLLYPAWDRFYAYGLYFFSRLTNILLLAGVLLQVAGIVWNFRPLKTRHDFERTLARQLKDELPVGSTVYTMDIDISLKTYLPDMQYRNIWEKVYDSIPSGSYFLFNETKMSQQWAGRNPMINWENAQKKYQLMTVDSFPEGWVLWKISQ